MENSDTAGKQSATLIYTAFIAGLCSIIYELLIATTVSYFMGDSVKVFLTHHWLIYGSNGSGLLSIEVHYGQTNTTICHRRNPTGDHWRYQYSIVVFHLYHYRIVLPHLCGTHFMYWFLNWVGNPFFNSVNG